MEVQGVKVLSHHRLFSSAVHPSSDFPSALFVPAVASVSIWVVIGGIIAMVAYAAALYGIFHGVLLISLVSYIDILFLA